MQKDIETTLKERYVRAPQVLKDFISSPAFDQKIISTASLYDLTDDQTTLLAETLLFELFGVISQQEFPNHIMVGLGLPKETAVAVATSVNQDLLRFLSPPPPQPSTLNPKPPSRPLSAELSESAGLKLPLPPAPPKPNRPLDAELSEQFRKPGDATGYTPPQEGYGGKGMGDREERKNPLVPPPKPSTLNAIPSVARPTPSFTTPPPPQEGYRGKGIGYREETKIPSIPPNLPTKPFTRQNFAEQNLGGQAPQEAPGATGYTLQATPPPAPPPSAPKPRVFENSFGEEHEENLNREDILRELENPTNARPSVERGSTEASRPNARPTPTQQLGAPLPEPPKQYDSDPYREPPN